jgi:TetR/AcrR family tetracycline transcriptional repressor
MRRVAEEVGAGTMTLYGYVRSKDEILDHLAARVLGDVDPPAVRRHDGDWRPALRRYFVELRATLVAHPEFERLFAVHGAASEAAFVHAESGFAVLADAGITGPRAARIWFACMTYTVGFVLWELPRLAEAAAGDAELARARERRMATLPPERFTHVTALAAVLTTSTSDEQFAFGLDALLSGCASADPGTAAG